MIICVQVDEDNSGSIDFDEFLTMMKKKMMENDRRSEDVRAAFSVFDQVNTQSYTRSDVM